MNILHSNNQPPNNWDQEMVLAGPTAGICQSTFWADFVTDMDHAKIHYLQVTEGNDLIVSLLIEQQAHKGLIRQVVSSLQSSTRGWLQWNFGPAIFTTDGELIERGLRILLAKVDEIALQEGLHHVIGNLSRTTSPEIFRRINTVFQEFNYQTHWWATLLIPLLEIEEALWRNLSPAARKAVNKAKKMGVVSKKVDETTFKSHFLESYKRFEQDAGRKFSDSTRMQTLWEKDAGRFYRFFTAHDQNGKVLATLGMHYFNGVATEIASSMSREAFVKKIPAQDLLHWDMICVAKSEGCHTFDLAGISPDPQGQKLIGIRRFKEKWGGKYKQYASYRKELRRGPLDFLISGNH